MADDTTTAAIEDVKRRLEELEAKLAGSPKAAALSDNILSGATDLDDLGRVKTFLEFEEGALAVGAPRPDVGRLFAVDRGGKTTLRYVDSDGVKSEVSHAPAVRVYNSIITVVPHNGTISVYFNSERFDTDGMHSTTVNQHRLTATTPGKYYISGALRFASNGVGRRTIAIRFNGGTVIAQQEWDTNQNSDTYMVVGTLWHLSAGQFVDLRVYQSSGGNLNLRASTGHAQEFMMHWVAP